MNKDLICAIANPPGVGAIGIIRLRGWCIRSSEKGNVETNGIEKLACIAKG